MKYKNEDFNKFPYEIGIIQNLSEDIKMIAAHYFATTSAYKTIRCHLFSPKLLLRLAIQDEMKSTSQINKLLGMPMLKNTLPDANSIV